MSHLFHSPFHGILLRIKFELKRHEYNPELAHAHTLPPAHECNNTCDISSGIRLLLDLSASQSVGRSVGFAKSGHLSFPS